MKKHIKFCLGLIMIFLILATANAEQLTIIKNPLVLKVEPISLQMLEKERNNFTESIKSNPNYFGTIPKSLLPPVVTIQYNTTYEELNYISFLPEQDLLKGFIDIKQPSGYKSDLCQNGSFEHVRFFADWNGDGDYLDDGEDLGVSGVNVHDIPNTAQSCSKESKPLTYTVFLNVQSKKLACKTPNLVKIRAILSWEKIPEEKNPDFIPAWGNVVEDWIQIKPVLFFTKLTPDLEPIAKLDLLSKSYYMDLPDSSKKVLQPKDLQTLYQDQKVSDLRFNFSNIYPQAKKILENPLFKKQEPNIADMKASLVKIHPELVLLQNVQYEQLNKVGLNYDLDTLTAALTVKKACGYSGGICDKGSYEYVAFWVYAQDSKEKMCLWRYMGTAQVNVHDIPTIPATGLKYSVKLPVNLDWLKNTCQTPSVVKVRAIMSWGTPPPTDQPFYNPPWGNRVDSLIQLKPQAPVGTKQVPFISAVGGMLITKIAGNDQTVVTSSIGPGYANGTSIEDGYCAVESPFGRKISISGHISNPPDLDPPVSAAKLQYRVQYRKVGKNWVDLQNSFSIGISKSEWNSATNITTWTQYSQPQQPVDGYYKYEVDLSGETQRFVEDDILGDWITPAPEGDGLYEIRVLLKSAGAPTIPDVPAGHLASNTVKIMVDNTPPEAVVTLEAGPCTKYTVGGLPIKGRFTATDEHIYRYKLWITPYSPPTISPGDVYYPTVPAPGEPNKEFSIDLTNAVSCGYVANLYVWDRAILNNHFIGNQRSASVGFCLLEPANTLSPASK
ncbi:MAG TPA: hypothetical protein VHY08_04920 [Bacillota bacterium]|nr:hypothetical protein [Bacillota bacterium]